MDREEDLKRIDLKVSANCCDGCKKKVLKALSIKGVLKTEIHPSLPKVIVIGNINPQILIKKLGKVGKIAELWPMETPKPEREDRLESNTDKASKIKGKELEKERPENSTDKNRKIKGKEEKESNGSIDEVLSISKQAAGGVPDLIGGIRVKDNMPHINGNGSEDAMRNESETSTHPLATTNKNIMLPTTVLTSVADGINCINHGILHNQATMMTTYVVPNPHPIVDSCSALPPCCRHHNFYYEVPVSQLTPVQSQAARGLTDYFNDDNTAGCCVM